MSIKPKDIFTVLDIAREVRKNGEVFNPLFSGPPGLGKSVIVQKWCQINSLPFIDLRAAYLEAPDLIGFPQVTDIKGRQVTDHATPAFWPTEGEGVILLDEPNRGNTSVLNTFMQILTDRKVHKYELPPGWMVVACINPEDEFHDVNTMDSALKDRFEIFNVRFDRDSFVEYVRKSEWHTDVVAFVETGTWKYAGPESIKAEGAKYVSPRTLSKLNSLLKTNFNKELEISLYEAILGRNYAQAFYTLRHNERPVLLKDLLNKSERSKALKRLKSFSNNESYKAGMISFTVRDIIEKGLTDDELIKDVVLAIPADQGPTFLRELSFKNKDTDMLKRLTSEYVEVKKYLQEHLL